MTMRQPSRVLLRAIFMGTALSGLVASAAVAQSSSDVTVNLDAIDPTLRAPLSGRIVLRPPPGATPISSSSFGKIIKLHPPSAPIAAAKPSAPSAPKTTVAAQAPSKPAPAKTMEPPASDIPAAPAPKPPAQPAPTKTAEATPPPVNKPAAPAKAALPPPAPAVTSPPPPPAETSTAPSVSVRKAQQDPAGPVAAPLPDKQQTAALPPAARTPAQESEEAAASLTIPFATGIADIDVSGQGIVKDLAGRMNADKSLRVQLMAYASDPDKNTSKARRLALDRAISIRNLLIDAGVERTRIEVRALGDQGEGGSLDRVDAVAVKR